MKFLSDANVCPKTNRRGLHPPCQAPINPVRLNKHCQQSEIVAMKVIYLCKLEWLVPLLKDPLLNVKIVHLVRDPRSTIASRIRSKKNKLSVVK